MSIRLTFFYVILFALFLSSLFKETALAEGSNALAANANHHEKVLTKKLSYYLEQENYFKALIVYKQLGGRVDSYYKHELRYLKALTATNSNEKYAAFKEYLFFMQADESLKANRLKAYFNKAKPKDVEQAKRMCIEALKHQPNLSTANYNLGILYARDANLAKAIFYLRRALRQHSNFDTLYSLGLLEMQIKNHQKAYQYFKEALHHREADSSLYNNLFITSKHVEDSWLTESRVFYIDQAIALSPSDYRLYLTKAVYLKEIGDTGGYTKQLHLALKKLNEIKKENYINYLDVLAVNEITEVAIAQKKAIQKVNEAIAFGNENLER